MMNTETLTNQVEELSREVTELKKQSGFVDHHAIALEELARIKTLADTSSRQANETLKHFAPLLAKWRKRGETATVKLPNRNNYIDVIRSLENLSQTSQELSVRIPETWKGIASSLAGEDALEQLPAILVRINHARAEARDILRMRDDVRRVVSKLETVATLNEE